MTHNVWNWRDGRPSIMAGDQSARKRKASTKVLDKKEVETGVRPVAIPNIKKQEAQIIADNRTEPLPWPHAVLNVK